METMEIIKMVAIAIWGLLGLISLIASVVYLVIFRHMFKPMINMSREMFKDSKEDEEVELKRIK
jgi:hypothetical protein